MLVTALVLVAVSTLLVAKAREAQPVPVRVKPKT